MKNLLSLIIVLIAAQMLWAQEGTKKTPAKKRSHTFQKSAKGLANTNAVQSKDDLQQKDMKLQKKNFDKKVQTK